MFKKAGCQYLETAAWKNHVAAQPDRPVDHGVSAVAC